MDLFSNQASLSPLAERVRPNNLDEVLGQEHLTGPEGPLRRALEDKKLYSMVFWGPPGTGKTTLAQILAGHSHMRFVPFSAVLCGIKDVKKVMEQALATRKTHGMATLIFVDEIHRFNKAQQDAFLPYVEKGDIVLIGATTENPSFEINSALLSRLRVFVLNPLSPAATHHILRRALQNDQELKKFAHQVSDEVLKNLAEHFAQDARTALNILEVALGLLGAKDELGKQHIQKAAQQQILQYDKNGEEHYNIISALHKSLRNSDADAALYWLARMLEAGEDPMYVVRRLVRFASEDVGNADPGALSLAIAAKDTVHFIGMPEAKLALAQLVVYLAAAPKSNSAYRAYQAVEKDIRQGKIYPVPLALRNAPTKLMKDLHYGEGYQYAHDDPQGTTALQCLPDELKNRTYYQGVELGFEREIIKRLAYFKNIRTQKRS